MTRRKCNKSVANCFKLQLHLRFSPRTGNSASSEHIQHRCTQKLRAVARLASYIRFLQHVAKVKFDQYSATLCCNLSLTTRATFSFRNRRRIKKEALCFLCKQGAPKAWEVKRANLLNFHVK